jgi:hypothetical protein
LAASALFALPAAANSARGKPQTSVTVSVGHDPHGRLSWNDSYGWHDSYRYDRRDRRAEQRIEAERRMQRDAVQQCRAAVNREAAHRGFRDVDFDGREVWRAGRFGYLVVLDAEFEGRRRDFDSHVRCEVQQGRIVSLTGIPVPGRRGHSPAYSYQDRGWRR